MAPLIAAALGLAPALIEYLGGKKASALATAAAEAIVGTSDPAEIKNLPPDQQAELRKELARIALAERQAELADVADARARDIALQAAGKRNVRADVMVALCVVGILGGVAFLSSGLIPSGSDVAGAVIGLLGLFSKCFADAFSFEFGSSRGSADRARTQDALLTTAVAKTADALNDASYQAARNAR
jgi:hypothetical protein